VLSVSTLGYGDCISCVIDTAAAHCPWPSAHCPMAVAGCVCQEHQHTGPYAGTALASNSCQLCCHVRILQTWSTPYGQHTCHCNGSDSSCMLLCGHLTPCTLCQHCPCGAHPTPHTPCSLPHDTLNVNPGAAMSMLGSTPSPAHQLPAGCVAHPQQPKQLLGAPTGLSSSEGECE
jgi:hypothetical protein